MSYHSNSFDMFRRLNKFKERSEIHFSFIFKEPVQKNETNPELPAYLSYSRFQLLFNAISSFFPNAPPQLQSCKSVEHNILEERAKPEQNNSSQTPVSSKL